jgi:hypothetical protein
MKQKTVIGLIVLALVIGGGFLINHFATGWEKVHINEHEQYDVVRFGTSYAKAEYSETSYDVLDDSWDTEYWDEPASDVNNFIEVNGTPLAEYENKNIVKVQGYSYLPIKRWTDISKTDLDTVKDNYTDEFLVKGPYGQYRFSSYQKYHKFLANKMAFKGCVANIHHGKLWNYELKGK